MFHVTTEKNGRQAPWVSTQSWATASAEARIERRLNSRIVCEPGCGHCEEVAAWNAAQEKAAAVVA